jgi:hypothetical protein
MPEVQRRLYGGDETSKDYTIQKYPNICDIAVRMALDNGCVNRSEPIEKFFETCDEVLASADVSDLLWLERWLDTLTEEQADILADGEESEKNALCAQAPRVGGDEPNGPLTTKLFDDIFEVM